MSVRQVFEKFDKNNDGKLSLEEFHEAALSFCNSYSQGQIEDIFDGLDVDGDGQIEADDFVWGVKKMLKEVFDFCDVDGDGKIPADELYVSMIKLGRECTEESCAEKVQVADADGDGFLNFEEFLAMVFSDF